jgi:hypothetical protein
MVEVKLRWGFGDVEVVRSAGSNRIVDIVG